MERSWYDCPWWSIYITYSCASPWAIPDMKNNGMKNKGNPKKKKAIYEWIISEIKEAEKYGILVNVEGVNYSSEETAELFHVLEDAVYMKEYLGDSEGRIIQINFDKITGM